MQRHGEIIKILHTTDGLYTTQKISKQKSLRMLEVCASEIAHEIILLERQWQRAFV